MLIEELKIHNENNDSEYFYNLRVIEKKIMTNMMILRKPLE